ncbi:MAG: bifunctional 23S rRNA (guanine(2069)-N(7))-methyltransferase RlmK/23S rRNA (guanine(2445)-N(2))-methyltransferase RlmL [Pseudomonadota bacterium]
MGHEIKRFIATCASGLEPLVADEITAFGGEVVTNVSGALSFTGTLETAYRACLWSRFSNRILYPLAEFTAADTDALYRGAYAVEWHEHFANSSTFAVDCTAVNSPLQHSHFAALKVKDAIVDQFRDRTQKRPSIRTARPDIQIRAFLHEQQASISIDLSGESLHQRGYRAAGGEAPLKESLAAGIVRLTGWTDAVSHGSVFLDPLCGSGTLLIEAGLIFGDMAPGLLRDYFGFIGWRKHAGELWARLLAEAQERRRKGLHKPWPMIIGYDASAAAIRNSTENIRRAGLSGMVHVERRELAELKNPSALKKEKGPEPGYIVVNPPYGERLSTISSVRYLYRCLGRKLKENFPGWRAGVFTNHVELADAIILEKLKKFRLYNGPIVCHVYLYDVPEELSVSPQQIRPFGTAAPAYEAEDFANRLQKNIRKLSKWAHQSTISCYRIYDADLPEYNIAVDVYEKWVHVQEYAPPKTVDPAKAGLRLRQALQAIEGVLGIRRNQVFIKVRQRQKGSSQYQKHSEQGRFYEVREGGCRFLVNLTDYLDTGLFLDHRVTRTMIQRKARGKRFLNLFAYTGTATVHAAMGGAKTTTTVDKSPVYLEWAESNLALNGFSAEQHRVVREDCTDWLANAQEQFDLIFVDPPTFSNTKSTAKVFDVQRDHVSLIKLAMRRLEPGGLLIFSTNFKRFTMDSAALPECEIKDITSATIPKDFERDPKIHQCWEIYRSSKK